MSFMPLDPCFYSVLQLYTIATVFCFNYIERWQPEITALTSILRLFYHFFFQSEPYTSCISWYLKRTFAVSSRIVSQLLREYVSGQRAYSFPLYVTFTVCTLFFPPLVQLRQPLQDLHTDSR